MSSNADILNNIASNLGSVERLITGAAYLMGISFAIKAMFALKQQGESRSAMSQNSSMKEPIMYFLVAAVLLYFPTAFKILMNTTFGYSSVLAYAPVESQSKIISNAFGSNSEAGHALSMIIQTIGLIAFIRGWVMIAKSASQGQQPGGTAKGLMHVFGGILAMNIIGTLQVLDNTLYGS
jgi:intracellular multiplication protein IcmC